MQTIKYPISGLGILFFLGIHYLGFSLSVGEKAPALSIQEWFNKPAQEQINLGDGKTVYIVEFWATWCPPCRQSIPHLNKLYETYKDRNVRIIGVTKEDKATVSPFVTKMKMAYWVGIDDKEKTHKGYMEGIDGIPHAFIIDKNGIVVWQGHPMNPEMETVLKQVIAGKFSKDTATELATQQKKKEALIKQFQEAAQKEDRKKMLETVNELIKLDPNDPIGYNVKIQLLNQIDKESNQKEIDQTFVTWSQIARKDFQQLLQLIMVKANMSSTKQDKLFLLEQLKHCVQLLEEEVKTDRK